MGFRQGFNAKLYYGSTGSALGSLAEAPETVDATINLTANQADRTTRGNSGWRAFAPGLRTAEVTGQVEFDPDSLGFFNALRDAFLSGTTIEVAAMSEARENAGAQGIKAAWSVTNFTWNQELEETQKVDFTLSLETYREWVEVS